MVIEIQDFSRDQRVVREERPTTTKIQDFLMEFVNIMKDKINTQNSKIERVRADVALLRQTDIESLRKSMKELDEKISLLEKKIEQQKPDVDSKILDTLRKV